MTTRFRCCCQVVAARVRRVHCGLVGAEPNCNPSGNVWLAQAHERFPHTVAALLAAGGPMEGGFLNAKFSVMDPGTVVHPHCGVSNKKLRAHLALFGCDPRVQIRVHNDTRAWQDGKVGSVRPGRRGRLV